MHYNYILHSLHNKTFQCKNINIKVVQFGLWSSFEIIFMTKLDIMQISSSSETNHMSSTSFHINVNTKCHTAWRGGRLSWELQLMPASPFTNCSGQSGGVDLTYIFPIITANAWPNFEMSVRLKLLSEIWGIVQWYPLPTKTIIDWDKNITMIRLPRVGFSENMLNSWKILISIINLHPSWFDMF